MSRYIEAVRPAVRRLLLLSLTLAVPLLTLTASSALPGAPQRAAAQTGPSGNDNVDSLITRIIRMADLDDATREAALAACLRKNLKSANLDRAAYQAIQACALGSAQAGGGVDLGDLAVAVTDKAEIDQQAQSKLAALLAEFKTSGLSDQELAAVAPLLSDCLRAYGYLTGSVDDTVVNACRDDFDNSGAQPAAGSSLNKPSIQSVGCPAVVTRGQDFTCAATVAGTATSLSWRIGGFPAATTGAQITTKIPADQPFGTVTVELTACNGTGDPATTCDTQSQTITVNPGPPIVGSPGCPASANIKVAVACSPSGVTGQTDDMTWQWTATNGSFDDPAGATPSVTFTAAGSQTVTVKACNPQVTENTPAACASASQQVTVVGAPTIASIGCNPQSGQKPLRVECSVSISDAVDQTTRTWSASGGASGSGDSFSTTFDREGTFTITFHACNGSACSTDQTFTITVSGPKAPQLGAIGCTPPAPNVGDSVKCTVAFDQSNPPTSFQWQSTGTPPSGSGATISTTFGSAGTHSVAVRACIGDACSTQSLALVVAPKQLTLNGSIAVTESDIGCGFSAMPSTSGTITFTVLGGSQPGQPGQVTGSFQGGGSGGRGISCSGGTANQSWRASYSATFAGSIDPISGAVNLTGKVNGTASASYSNCKDTDGKSASCPPPGGSFSYVVHITGTIGGPGSGAGSIMIDSGCSTAGTWTVR